MGAAQDKFKTGYTKKWKYCEGNLEETYGVCLDEQVIYFYVQVWAMRYVVVLFINKQDTIELYDRVFEKFGPLLNCPILFF